MSRVPFFLQLRSLITLIIVGNLLLLAIGVSLYLAEQSRIETSSRTVAEQIRRVLQNEIEGSVTALQSLAPMVREAGGSISKTRTIINNHVTRAGKNLRIAWTDHTMHLRIGTTVGVFDSSKDNPHTPKLVDESLDLSFRDYIQSAAKNPGTIVFGSVRPHLITGRPFFAVAMGVASEKGDYLGCLASIMDIENLRTLFDSMVQDLPLQITVTLSNGDTLYQHQAHKAASHRDTMNDSHFTIEYATLDDASHHNVTSFIQKFAMWFFVLNLLMGIGMALVYYSYVRPLHELAATFLTLPKHLMPNLPEGADSVTDVVNRAKAIKNQLLHYHLNRSESQESLSTLKEAIQQIHSLHDEQVDFLRTLSAEMETTFSSISRYAGFVEGGLSEDYFHNDEVFIENLKDSAQNLKFLSNAFYLMCLHKSGNYTAMTESVDVRDLLSQVITLFQAAADFRNMRLELETEGDTVVNADSAVLRHLFWGTMYLLMRFADDGAKIRLVISRTDSTTIRLTAGASECLSGLVNEADPDLVAFFPDSLSKTGQLQEAIRNHVDLKVIDYLAQHFCHGSRVEIQTKSHENGSLSFDLQLILRLAAPTPYPATERAAKTSTES